MNISIKEYKHKKDYDIAAQIFLQKLPIVDIISVNSSSGGKCFILEKLGIDTDGELICDADDKWCGYKISINKGIKYAKKVRDLFLNKPKKLKVWR
jgi:hypothetical protein